MILEIYFDNDIQKSTGLLNIYSRFLIFFTLCFCTKDSYGNLKLLYIYLYVILY